MRTVLPIVGVVVLTLMVGLAPGAPDERPDLRAWVRAALFGESAATVATAPGLEVRRQDYGQFRQNRSVMDTPLKIGEKDCKRGLGTHAVSEIVVHLAAAGKRFEAEVGVDNNYDTKGVKGSVIFAVDVGGKEAWRSGVCKGGQAPVAVAVDLGGAKEFVLRVLDDGDGPEYDQSDWAEAQVTMESGEKLWLDEMKVLTKATALSPATPFSFVYGDKPSSQFLPQWNFVSAKGAAEGGRERHTATWADPETHLQVAAEVTLFADYPAAEWVLRFTNRGEADTPILSDIRPLDMRVAAPDKGPVILHRAQGSTCGPTDFLPIDLPLAPNAAVDFAPGGGRSSNGALPFFNVEWQGGGLLVAIGWSGQWAARVLRDAAGSLTLQAGQQGTHFTLHAGESVRTPRMLLVKWDGPDRLRGHNLLRRLMIAHYVPRVAGEPVLPPLSHNTWFTFAEGNKVNQENQIEAMGPMAAMGNELFWLDAGWFEGGWPTGVGSWSPRPDAFPKGLRPLGDQAHKLGMKFIVWFEPERVHPASRIGKEHPEFVLRTGDGDGLFNLGDPKARQWLTDYLVKFIEESGIDAYRNDFNIDPLPFWQKADAPDRQGIAEIRYIEGLYAMWDDLIKRQPGLWIDNCASGGRRIDLEMCSRSLPLWQSDTQCCGHAEPIQDQTQNAGLSLWVPLHSAGCWAVDPYTFRSITTTGTSFCMDSRPAEFPLAQAKAAIAEAKSLRPLYLGDFYPLTENLPDASLWAGWQMDRPELGRGFAMLFRRPKSPYVAMEAALRGLDPAARYEVTIFETYEAKEKRTMSGAELGLLRIEIPTAPGSVLVRYEKAGK